MNSTTLSNASMLTGRIMLSARFIIAGAFLVLYAQGPGQWALNPQSKLQEA